MQMMRSYPMIAAQMEAKMSDELASVLVVLGIIVSLWILLQWGKQDALRSIAREEKRAVEQKGRGQ